ncbi:MAG: futalosine hydrolase [Vicinamibacterales bacterium]
MRLLLVAATVAEIQPILDPLPLGYSLSPRLARIHHSRHQIDVLITGVGMVQTAVWCARTLREHPPELALNVGVCGSFNPRFAPGAVVHVLSDRMSELGAEDGDSFLDIVELGLLGHDEPSFPSGRLENQAPPRAVDRLPHAHGITVNTVHGRESSIQTVVKRWAPDVESMEGAAFMYACQVEGVPFAQIRAVSNRVERRNRAGWHMAEAIARLSEEVARVVDEL